MDGRTGRPGWQTGSPAYKNYLLTVLMTVQACSYLDRQVLGLGMQNIKMDLALSDTQLGLLTGIAFALFYSVMGIPIARWADRGNRVAIISLTAALWSIAVALCGTAASFTQLLLVRAGVAVGEAGCIPPAHSLIADSFNRADRPRAVARYMLGAPISCVVGYFLAGWLNQRLGWRATFMILSVPGLVMAALAWLSLREPRHEHPAQRPAAPLATVNGPSGTDVALLGLPPENLKMVFRSLWANATFRHLLFAFSVLYFFGTGIGQWQPTFLIRSYGLGTAELGVWFALIYGVGGMLGTYLGGEWVARHATHNENLQLQAIAALYVVCGLASAGIYLVPGAYAALAFMALGALGGTLITAPLFAVIQTVVPPRMRAMSIAVLYFFGNLIGLGLGPLAAGALSDALHPTLGEESLRYALLALCPGYLWVAWHLLKASKTVKHDLERAETLTIPASGQNT